MTGSLCVSAWWQKVQVSVLFRASSNVCLAGSTGLWQASHALTLTGPCRTLKFLTVEWHSDVTQESRAMTCVGRGAGAAARSGPDISISMTMTSDARFMMHLASSED